MFTSKVRRLMVAVALVAVAGVAGAGATNFHGHKIGATPLPVATGDLGEIVIYAPGDLGEVVVMAPRNLPDVLVSVARVPFDAPILADADIAAFGANAPAGDALLEWVAAGY
jgi:hypothetical protein